ncbi:hypothetical protein, partial [uncultured Roseobacter sp.]|uniref:hypothetical protein n=1 Tax=uncultured Roseobacter sp. TaxID=114847 RepID=UPI00262E4C06
HKGARASLEAALSALATRCFSTEWADSGPSLHMREQPGSMMKPDIQNSERSILEVLRKNV